MTGHRLRVINGGKKAGRKLTGLEMIMGCHGVDSMGYSTWSTTLDASGTPLTLEMLQWTIWRMQGKAKPRLIYATPIVDQ